MRSKQNFKDYIKNKYSYEDVMEYLDIVKNLNVLVIGETIQDIYQFGYTLGKSGKAPVVAFNNKEKEVYDGGVIAIYKHLQDICNVDYITGEKCIIKTRYIENNQKLFETYSEKDNIHYKPNSTDISDYDVVIVADFGHGLIRRRLRDKIIRQSNFLSVNAQLNAGNMGINTINKYNSKIDYICISERELRLAFSDQFERLNDILMDRFNEDDVVSITKGSKGSTILKDNIIYNYPALADNIVDTVGAGDTYLSITSPLVYINAPADIIGFIGNSAGAIACTYYANKNHIDKKKLCKFIKDIYESG